MNQNKSIFIHIPKTGGTTINCAINGTQWQTKPDFNYRHILYETKRSNSRDIFEAKNADKYKNHQIFTMLRDPVDRLISEYYFIKDRPEFMQQLRKKPSNFEQFVESRQTQNYMVGFLVGKKMYDPSPPTKKDLEMVLTAIDTLPIYVGVFEYFAESLAYFQENIDIKWPKEIKAKRITLNRPNKDTISEELKKKIYDCNALDLQLYQHALDILKTKDIENYKTGIVFDKNKYEYVIKYTQRFSLLELFLKNKRFLKFQKEYFHQLSWYLQHNLQFKNGESYTLTYLNAFVNIMNSYIKNPSLLTAIMQQNLLPLEKVEAICTILDEQILPRERMLQAKKIKFNPKDVQPMEHPTVKAVNEQSSAHTTGIISKFKGLFGRN